MIVFYVLIKLLANYVTMGFISMLQKHVLYVMLVATVAVEKVPFFAMNVQWIRVIIFTMKNVYRLAQNTNMVN